MTTGYAPVAVTACFFISLAEPRNQLLIHFVHAADPHPVCHHRVERARGFEAVRGHNALQDEPDVDPRRRRRLNQTELL